MPEHRSHYDKSDGNKEWIEGLDDTDLEFLRSIVEVLQGQQISKPNPPSGILEFQRGMQMVRDIGVAKKMTVWLAGATAAVAAFVAAVTAVASYFHLGPK